MGVLSLGPGQDFAFQIIKGGKQGDRPVPDVIMGSGPDVANSQREGRLSPF